MRHVLYFYSISLRRFECVLGLAVASQCTNQYFILPRQALFQFIDLRGMDDSDSLNGKSEPRIWSRVHATAANNSDCAPRALLFPLCSVFSSLKLQSYQLVRWENFSSTLSQRAYIVPYDMKRPICCTDPAHSSSSCFIA